MIRSRTFPRVLISDAEHKLVRHLFILFGIRGSNLGTVLKEVSVTMHLRLKRHVSE